MTEAQLLAESRDTYKICIEQWRQVSRSCHRIPTSHIVEALHRVGGTLVTNAAELVDSIKAGDLVDSVKAAGLGGRTHDIIMCEVAMRFGIEIVLLELARQLKPADKDCRGAEDDRG
ncbi:MAG: hypothetical protein IH983_10690 [Planctomycetes bacterium]|nr:hypothetical protein [Planctomycetota bacterium]